MKSFKFIREGNSVEPGVSEIDDVQDDPLSFVEIKPKKTKVVKEDLQEAVSVKKEKHSWGTMMTVHHGSDTSYPLHPEHQSAIKKLRPGMKTTFKDETNSTVHAHREGDTVHLTRPKTGSTLTSLPYHHFDTSEHAKPAAKKPAGEYDRKVTSHLKKKYNEETEQMDEKLTSKDIKMAVGVAKDKRYAGGNMSGAVKTMEKIKPGLSKHPRVQQVLKSTNEGIDFLKIWNGIKPVHEEVKTTHEDPLVLTKDAEGHIHTHANLSVANAIHGTDVKHQAIHSGKPVQAGKFTFELSKHHAGALKEDAPFDPVAHKKELDQLMGKHMAAHTQTTKLINAKAPQEQINKAQERNNAIKQEIRAHKDKVPKGPAPKPGSAADYYASKKPGEYTGD
jgi:hypothetical protein